MLSASKSGSGLATGYNLTRSLRFRSAATADLERTPSTTGTGGSKTWTYSIWLKRGLLATRQSLVDGYASSAGHVLEFTSSDTLEFYAWGGAAALDLITTQVFRDPSAYYHIVLAVDTTQATAANRIKLYINGAQVTAFSTATYPTQNALTYIGSNVLQDIGRRGSNQFYSDCYLAEVNFIDGQALTPSSFGSTNALTGVWQPAKYSGTYGTNGFYLPFTDNSALTTSSNVGLGKDFSGNGNYWTTNNISITAGVTYDSMTDVPTLTSATAANFAVLNPLAAASAYTVSGGNLNYSGTASTTASYYCRSTMAIPSGKFYFEFVASSLSANALTVGIQDITLSATTGLSNQSTGAYGYFVDGSKETVAGLAAYGASWGVGDVIGVAFDSSAGSLTFYKNNTSQGVAFTGITGSYCAYVSLATAGSSKTIVGSINFGQQPFTYTPPTGFVALCTFNLPTSTIAQGNKVMDATLYTGNGSTQTITNAAGFKPDLIWNKMRSGAYYNILTDSVRGTNSQLFSNDTLAQETRTDRITAINSNGFSVGSYADVNANTQTFVGWQWQAGQGTTSSNTNGSITSTVSVNASAGFSVVTYTGTGSGTPTIGHGLGVTPALIIGKNRSGSAQNWQVWHTSIGDNVLQLNLTNAQVASTANSVFIVAGINSSVFQVGTNPSLNGSATTQVAYCWTPIAGFSAFGSYSGNNSTDGPMVYTGFQPKFVLIKGTGNASGWQLQDSARNTYNVVNAVLRPDLSAAESTGYGGVIDFLSNGFKLRTTDTNYNNSGYGPYIYMAFATNPFKQSLAF